MDLGDVGGAGARFDQKCGRIARHPDEEEYRQRQQQQRQEAVTDSSTDELCHDVLGLDGLAYTLRYALFIVMSS